MRLFRTGMAAALAAVAVAVSPAPVSTQDGWQAQSRDAKRASVTAGDKALLQACAPEIAAMVAEARQGGATVQDADLPRLISEMITNWWWAEGATDGIRAEYRNTGRRQSDGEIGYAFTQCAIATIDAWKEGVRQPATLRAKWKPYPAGYSATATGSATPAPPTAPAAEASSREAYPPDDKPVDCVRLDDKPGAFKNDCTFDVYFTYCGVNPAKDSWVAECSKQKFGLLDVAAGGVQAAFTRAETLYLFECRSPKTPKEVEFTGNGLRGYCK